MLSNLGRSFVILSTKPPHLYQRNCSTSSIRKNAKTAESLIQTLSEKLHINTPDDWYKISAKDIKTYGGATLLDNKGGSPLKLISDFFPDRQWLPWKFKSAPKNFWKSQENQRQYMNWLGNILGIKEMDDWYNVKQKDFDENHGSGILNYYNDSPTKLLLSVFPEHNWEEWKFTTVPMGFWSNIENQKKFLNKIANKIGVKSMEDWYISRALEIRKNGGSYLLHMYKNSYIKMITSIFSDYNWSIFKFETLPKNYLQSLQQDPQKRDEFIKFLSDKFGITKTEDWYRVTHDQVRQLFFMRHYELMEIVKIYYPDLNLNVFQRNNLVYKKSQFTLKYMISKLFPSHEIIEDYRVPELDFKELDYFLPELKIAFEYQGIQHYHEFHNFRPLNVTKQSDQLKEEKCK